VLRKQHRGRSHGVENSGFHTRLLDYNMIREKAQLFTLEQIFRQRKFLRLSATIFSNPRHQSSPRERQRVSKGWQEKSVLFSVTQLAVDTCLPLVDVHNS